MIFNFFSRSKRLGSGYWDIPVGSIILVVYKKGLIAKIVRFFEAIKRPKEFMDVLCRKGQLIPTHAMIYAGKDGKGIDRCWSAEMKGVELGYMHDYINKNIELIVCSYLPMTVIQSDAILSYCKSKEGTPYNFGGILLNMLGLIGWIPGFSWLFSKTLLGDFYWGIYCSEMCVDGYESTAAKIQISFANANNTTPFDIQNFLSHFEYINQNIFISMNGNWKLTLHTYEMVTKFFALGKRKNA